SPDGTKVFVTGQSVGAGSSFWDFATVAYDAATGTALWTRRYDGAAHENDFARSVAVSPDGTRVFVTGGSEGLGYDYATVSYRASTGATLWVERYNGPANLDDIA